MNKKSAIQCVRKEMQTEAEKESKANGSLGKCKTTMQIRVWDIAKSYFPKKKKSFKFWKLHRCILLRCFWFCVHHLADKSQLFQSIHNLISSFSVRWLTNLAIRLLIISIATCTKYTNIAKQMVTFGRNDAIFMRNYLNKI